MTTNNTQVPVATPQAAPAKAKSPYKGYNIALYVGSAFIVIAAFFFAGSAGDEFFAPTLLIVTTIMYLAGLALLKTVDYLKPVASSFMITGLAMTATWFMAFDSFGMDAEAALFLGCLIFTICSYVTTLLLKKNALGYISYFATFAVVKAFCDMLDIGDTGQYIQGLLWMLISCTIAVLWYNRVNWLPVPFRHATRALSSWTTITTCILIGVPALNNGDTPFLATLMIGITLLQYIYGFIRSRTPNKLLLVRALVQLFVCVLVIDFMTITGASMNTKRFGMGLIIFATSAAQLAYSLFVDRMEGANASNENLLTVLAALGLLYSTTFFSSLTGQQQSVVRLITYAVIGGFGIGLCYKRKKAGWLLLPFAALMLTPAEIGFNIVKPHWGSWIFMGAYTILSVIFTGIYIGIRNFKEQENETFMVTFGSTLAALFVVVAICFAEQHAELGWLVATIITATQAYFANRKDALEFPLYTGALCLYSVSNQIFGNIMDHHVTFGPSGQQIELVRSVIGIHILALAPAIAGFWKERGQKSTVRLMLAYYLLSLIVLGDAWIMRTGFDSISLALFFLVEQVILMIIGIIWKRGWLTNSAIVFSFLVVFYMSTGYGYLWLFVIGLALITGVVMSLTKAHNNQIQEKAAAATEPVTIAPENTAADKNTEAAQPEAKETPKTQDKTPQDNSDNGSSRLGKKPHSAKYE